jgi:hypothetical protein
VNVFVNEELKEVKVRKDFPLDEVLWAFFIGLPVEDGWLFELVVVRVQADLGEEHQVRLFPRWENQKTQICAAFDREMVPDDS